MNRVAQFEKISHNQFMTDWSNEYGEPENSDVCKSVNAIYELAKLPTRATSGSAGYDFYSPLNVKIEPGATVKIPTLMRCKIDEGWVLNIYPRSSLGFKYQMALCNTVGIIDSDYYNSDNEGHIWVKVVNNGSKTLEIKADDRFAQGVFTPFGITYDDEVSTERTGGMGSTGK